MAGVKAGDGGWYFYENGQLKTGWLYRNGNWYWLDPDRNGRMAENSWFTYDNNFYYAKGDGAIYKNGFQEVDGNLYYFQSWGGIQKNVYLSISGKNVLCTGKWYRCPWNSQNNEWTW